MDMEDNEEFDLEEDMDLYDDTDFDEEGDSQEDFDSGDIDWWGKDNVGWNVW